MNILDEFVTFLMSYLDVSRYYRAKQLANIDDEFATFDRDHVDVSMPFSSRHPLNMPFDAVSTLPRFHPDVSMLRSE